MAQSDLLRSHHELRAALRLAEQEIRKLNFGRDDSPVLKGPAPGPQRGAGCRKGGSARRSSFEPAGVNRVSRRSTSFQVESGPGLSLAARPWSMPKNRLPDLPVAFYSPETDLQGISDFHIG